MLAARGAGGKHRLPVDLKRAVVRRLSQEIHGDQRVTPPAVAVQGVCQRVTAALVIPGEWFRATPFEPWFYGSNYRDLWPTSIELPVLDLDRVGGGLTPLRRRPRHTMPGSNPSPVSKVTGLHTEFLTGSLAVVIGRGAILSGSTVLFTTAAALVASLAKAHLTGRLEENSSTTRSRSS